MTQHKRTTWLIGLLLVALALLCLACYLSFWHDDVAATAIQLTTQVVDAAATHPAGVIQADVLPPSMQIGDDCWRLLQETLKQNSGQYTLAVLKSTGNFDPPRGNASAVVVIKFPDGHHIPMEYLNRVGLYGCTGE